MEGVGEELGGWRKEIGELEDMRAQSRELQLGQDFISQLDTFLPVSSQLLQGEKKGDNYRHQYSDTPELVC